MAAAKATETVEQTPLSLPLHGSASAERSSSDSKKKNRKYRYRKQGYHKMERENARRVEARNFLSGITLDSQYKAPIETQEEDTCMFHVPSKHGGSSMEESKVELPDEMDRLYDLYAHNSPVKLPPSMSLDLGFDYSSHSYHMVNRSTSLYESATSTPSCERKKLSLQYLPHTKSLGEVGDIHYFGRPQEFGYQEFPVDSRYVDLKGLVTQLN